MSLDDSIMPRVSMAITAVAASKAGRTRDTGSAAGLHGGNCRGCIKGQVAGRPAASGMRVSMAITAVAASKVASADDLDGVGRRVSMAVTAVAASKVSARDECVLTLRYGLHGGNCRGCIKGEDRCMIVVKQFGVHGDNCRGCIKG